MAQDTLYEGTRTGSWSAESLAADPRPTLFQKVLLSTDGTVTELVALHAGCAIRARKLLQSFSDGGGPALLACASQERILHRAIVLGTTEGAEYLFADSVFVYDRFSAAIQRDLIATELPIGLLWRREQLEMYRDISDRYIEVCAEVAAVLQVPLATPLYCRRYTIFHQGRALGVITEKFAATALR